MDWRTRKQLTILLTVFLVVFGIGVAAAYLVLKEPPSCFDNRKNQGETEADCGGPCVPCEFRRQKPVEVLFARFIRVRGNTYDIVGQIQNPNDHLAGNPLGYRAKLFDDKGAEVANRENITHVYPNDKIYIVESNFFTERTVVRAALEVVAENTVWTYTEEIRPELTLGNRKYEVIREGGEEYARVTAELVSRAPFVFRKVEVRAALLDEAGNVVAAGATEARDVKSGKARQVIFTWPEKPRGSVVRIDMEARANALDPGNLIPL